MNNTIRFDVTNLVGITYENNGKSIRLEIIDSIPPYGTQFLTFKNAYLVRLCQDEDSGFPFVVCEITCQHIAQDENEDVLRKLGYPFVDVAGRPRIAAKRLLVAHLEGAITGDIIADDLDIHPK